MVFNSKIFGLICDIIISLMVLSSCCRYQMPIFILNLELCYSIIRLGCASLTVESSNANMSYSERIL